MQDITRVKRWWWESSAVRLLAVNTLSATCKLFDGRHLVGGRTLINPMRQAMVAAGSAATLITGDN
jgi:hypothetical protein